VLVSFSKNSPDPFFLFFLEFQPGSVYVIVNVNATATNVAVRKQVEAVAADAIVDIYVKINFIICKYIN